MIVGDVADKPGFSVCVEEHVSLGMLAICVAAIPFAVFFIVCTSGNLVWNEEDEFFDFFNVNMCGFPVAKIFLFVKNEH